MPDIAAGQLYAYRVDGPFDPDRGHRFDRDKVLLDPYRRGVARPAGWGSREAACLRATTSRPRMKSVVVDPGGYDWEGIGRCRPFAKTVIYEMHVGGFTRHRNSAWRRTGAAPMPG